MTTKKQRAAIHFCESWLGVSFSGNRFDFNYEAYIWEKL